MTPCGTTDFLFSKAWLRWLYKSRDLVRWLDAGSLEGYMRRSLEVSPHQPALAVQIKSYCLELFQVMHKLWPGNITALLFHSSLQVYLQAQGQEASHDMSDAGLIQM